MQQNRPILQVENLEVIFRDGSTDLEALAGVNFSIRAQEFVCLLGPSGSGKSTLLRVIAGLLHPTSGSVSFSLNGDQRQQPRIGLVFQQANLMPWRTVLGNITLPLEMQGMRLDPARKMAQEMVERVGLQGFEHEWPRNLSGGMAQRVALGRALIQDPDLLLLDEPFGSLDALTREQMGTELLELWQQRRTTVLMVTHSISESIYLADRVLVLSRRPGMICQDLTVDLERPRQDETRYGAHFQELARALRAGIDSL